MADASTRLSFREKLGYGLGDTASNFFFQTFNIFLLYYYTDVFGIAAAAVGTMFFVTKLFDAINDPLMGIIADRTRSRFGKYRPYLLWMAIPYGVIGWLMFLNPDLSDSGKLVYAWVTYSLMMIVYTAINVPYSALMGVMTPDSHERTSISSYRFVCAFGGGLVISMLVRPLTRYFGGGDEAQGFATTMAVFAVASIALFWFTFATTKERVHVPSDGDTSLKRDLKMLVTNRPWLVMVAAAVFTLANVAVKNAVTVHYFKYYIGDDGSPYFWFLDRTTLFFTLGSMALIAGVACTQWFARRFEKKSLMIWLSLANAVAMASIFFVPPDQYWTLMIVNIVGTFIVGPTPALVWAMYADVADYGEWRHGRRTTALVFSAAQFAQKFGLTIGAGLAGWMLGLVGFEANVAQTDESLLGIRLMFTVIPATLATLNALVLIFYNLSDEQVDRIGEELEARRAAA